jgi:hypothetical protein
LIWKANKFCEKDRVHFKCTVAINASTCTATKVESSSWCKKKKSVTGPTVKQCKKEKKKIKRDGYINNSKNEN